MTEPSNKFFIELLLKGSDEFDLWRKENPQVKENDGKYTNCVNLKDADFSSVADDEIVFDHINFGYDADFSNCNFGAKAIAFKNCWFESETKFFKTKFGKSVLFKDCIISGDLKFEKLIIEVFRFERIEFRGIANFTSLKFLSPTAFLDCNFYMPANFSHCNFEEFADFANSVFDPNSVFFKCEFHKGANFGQFTKGEIIRNTFGRGEFSRVCLPKFMETKFFYHLITTGRNISGASFFKSKFRFFPDFLSDQNAGKVDFSEVDFDILTNSKIQSSSFSNLNGSAIVKIRELRKIAEDNKNHSLDSKLYIQEIRALNRLNSKHLLSDLSNGRLALLDRLDSLFQLFSVTGLRFLNFLYGAFSNYGKSIVLPTIWYLLSFPVFYFLYFSMFFPIESSAISDKNLVGSDIDHYNATFEALVWANGAPFIGNSILDNGLKKFLFCPNIKNVSSQAISCFPPENYFLLSSIQFIISSVLIFLILLGVRNYYRIK